MSYIEWKDTISVGVKALDDDHIKLINMINELHMGVIAGAKVSTLEKTLDGLINYSKHHFEKEENLLEKYKYPGLSQHKIEHKKLINQILEYVDKFKNGKSTFSLELMAFLRDWLINHIQGTDMKYKDYLSQNTAS